MSDFPICCHTCRKTINHLYLPFRNRAREIQSAAAEVKREGRAVAAAVALAFASSSPDPDSAIARDMAAIREGASTHDMLAGVLSGLGIHNLCCRVIFQSHVSFEMDDLAARGEHLGDLSARTAGELSGTVRVIRKPSGGRRVKPSVLLAR